MATKKIKQAKSEISTIILNGGISNKMKSYEPRSLLKIGESTIIEEQYKIFSSQFNGGIVNVTGFKSSKVCRKTFHLENYRIVENQRYRDTCAAESIRIGVNNTKSTSLFVCHGDVVFNKETLNLPYDKSFIIVDSKGQIAEREIGVTCIDDHASILSYDLPLKWCQMAFFTGKECRLLRSLCRRDKFGISHFLFFEVLNFIIERGGKFLCLEPNKMKIFEIDSMSDLYENTNIQ